MSNRLADPDELADKMSNGQSAGTTFRAAWRPETSVLRTPVCQHHEQPICDKLEHGIRPERTSVVGSGAWLPTKLFPKRAHLREIGTSPQPEAP